MRGSTAGLCARTDATRTHCEHERRARDRAPTTDASDYDETAEGLHELALHRPDEMTLRLLRADEYVGGHSWAMVDVGTRGRVAAVRCELIHDSFAMRRFVTEAGIRVALMRALAPLAEIVGPKMAFVVFAAEEAFRGDLDLEGLHETINGCFPDPAAAHDPAERKEREEQMRANPHATNFAWQVEKQLGEGLNTIFSPDVGGFVVIVANALPAEHHRLLDDLPERFDREIRRLTAEDNRCACPDCLAPCEASCVCPAAERARRRFFEVLKKRGDELAALSDLGEGLLRASTETRDGVPLEPVVTPAMRAALREIADENGHAAAIDPERTEELGGLEYAFAARVREAEQVMPRAALARMLILVATVALLREADRAARVVAGSLLLRALDCVRGRISSETLEREIETLVSDDPSMGLATHVAASVVAARALGGSMAFDASWLAQYAADIWQAGGDACHGRWAITVLVDTVDDCVRAVSEEPTSPLENALDDLRAFLLEPGVEIKHELAAE